MRHISAITLLLSALGGCEPDGGGGGASVVVNDAPCAGGSVALEFSDLVVGAPAGRTVFLENADGSLEGGVFDADVGFGEGTDAAFSLLRDPFVASEALVLPLRIQPTVAGNVGGSIVVVVDDALACTIQLSASTS